MRRKVEVQSNGARCIQLKLPVDIEYYSFGIRRKIQILYIPVHTPKVILTEQKVLPKCQNWHRSVVVPVDGQLIKGGRIVLRLRRNVNTFLRCRHLH